MYLLLFIFENANITLLNPTGFFVWLIDCFDSRAMPTLDPSAFTDLLDPSAALDVRIRSLYKLKEQQRNIEGAQMLLDAVDTTDSVLLQHELLYNVGQFGYVQCIPRLVAIIKSSPPARPAYDLVSRHEAIEALGAIGDPSIVPLLEELEQSKDEPAPIRESCMLALRRIRLVGDLGSGAVAPPPGCQYVSVDPAPAMKGESSVAALRQQLLDASVSLWERYQAMFQLRNIGTEEAVLALSAALRDDQTSCLFRHEVAFVLGQLEHPASSPALSAALKDVAEHPMVRHEAAEALGALAEKDTLGLLEQFCSDSQAIVRDSCVVAIEMHKYWSAFKPSGN